MNRTAEKVLSIISLVFTVLALIGSVIGTFFMRALTSNSALRAEFEMELYADPTLTFDDVEMIVGLFELFEGFGWFSVVLFFISTVTTIIGMIFMWKNKNPKLAGVMFIIAGLFALIISPTSIMLYVAAILCFTRKAPVEPEEQSFIEKNYDDSMRPL